MNKKEQIKTLSHYREVLPYVAVIQESMLRKVNAKDVEEFDFNQKDWFLKYSWTEEEQEEFGRELYTFFDNNKEAQMEVFNGIPKSGGLLSQRINFFLFNYGWKLL
jgi:nitrate reductase assembly molybdenum cofactor insertion protein NarJ